MSDLNLMETIINVVTLVHLCVSFKMSRHDYKSCHTIKEYTIKEYTKDVLLISFIYSASIFFFSVFCFVLVKFFLVFKG